MFRRPRPLLVPLRLLANAAGSLVALLALLAAPSRAAADAAWTSTAPMPHGFAFHGAVVLKDGKVLFAGGATDQNLTSVYGDVALFDPATKTWSALPKLAIARASAAAVTLADGRVWVVAGAIGNNQGTSTTELFDPATMAWSAGPPVSTPNAGHTATLLPDGKVLVVGGSTPDGAGGFTLLSTTEIYDPVAGTVSAGPPLATARAVHTATLLVNPATPTVGRLFIAGGGMPPQSGQTLTLSSAEIYDTATKKWTTASAMPHARLGHTATMTPDGSILVAGGLDESVIVDTADVYGAIGFWKSPASMKSKRSFHAAALLPSGRVIVVGGIDGAGVHSSAEIYDPASEGWLAADSMPHPHAAPSATRLADGSILVAGGFDALGQLSSAAELFQAAAAGAACTSAGNCDSGSCVDGVCCDTKCDGQCQACDVAGSVGKCSTVTGQPHGTRPKCEPYACGATACDTTCKAPSDCAAGYACNPSGACVPGTTCSADGRSQISADTGESKDCSPYLCADGKCGSICRSSNDCAAGASCDASGLCVASQGPGDSGGGCAVPATIAEPAGRVGAIAAVLALLGGARSLARRRRR